MGRIHRIVAGEEPRQGLIGDVERLRDANDGLAARQPCARVKCDTSSTWGSIAVSASMLRARQSLPEAVLHFRIAPSMNLRRRRLHDFMPAGRTDAASAYDQYRLRTMQPAMVEGLHARHSCRWMGLSNAERLRRSDA